MLAVLKLLVQGFGASMSGVPLDLWLAGLSEQDRATLTAFSQDVAGRAPALLVESTESTDESGQG